MKSQFKKADASGARYALIFGDDELARGEVAVKPLRDAAGAAAQPAAGRRRRLGGRPAPPHNPAFSDAPTAPAMATHLDLEEQEQLDQLKHFWKQYGNLITWVLIAVLAGFAAWNGWNWWQRDQAVKAARDVRRARARRAGRRRRPRPARVFADMKERFAAHRLRAAGRPAGGQGAVREGPGRRRHGHAGLGGRQRHRGRVPDDRAPAPGRRAARPEEVRRGAEAARRRHRARSSRRWWPTAAATSCSRRARPTRPRPPTSKAWKRDGPEASSTAAWSRPS